MPETQHDYPDVVANYLLQECLGSGFSGSIFRGVNVYNGQQAAVKLQPVDVDCPTNMFERNFYPAIQGGMGIPSLHACGVQGKYDYLVIDLLGPSLDSLFRKSGKDVMDLRSVCFSAPSCTMHPFLLQDLPIRAHARQGRPAPRYPARELCSRTRLQQMAHLIARSRATSLGTTGSPLWVFIVREKCPQGAMIWRRWRSCSFIC